jgi:hypothetical protein
VDIFHYALGEGLDNKLMDNPARPNVARLAVVPFEVSFSICINALIIGGGKS